MIWELHCGRAQDVLYEYVGVVDLALTSPPYDALRSYGGHLEAFDFAGIADGIVRSLTPGGVLVWVTADGVVDGAETGNSFRQALQFVDAGLRLHQTLIYAKNGVPGKVWTKRHTMEHQYMFVLSNGEPKTVNIIADRKMFYGGATPKGTVRERNGELRPMKRNNPLPDVGRRGTVWTYDPGFRKCHPGEGHLPHQHPATFPRKLAEDHIRTWTNPGDTVLDPMAGSGTVLRAAVNLGRKGIGIEVNPQYCQIIEQRMAQGVLL